MTQETAAQNIKKQLKSSIENGKIEGLRSKPMHGQFYRHLERTSGDKEKYLAWLCSTGLKGEMESLIRAAQDQTLNIGYHQRNTIKPLTENKCTTCYMAKHTKHSVAGSTTLAPSEYPNRHNKVAGYIHSMICNNMGLQFTDKYYGHVPEMVINVNGTTIMWDILVITDQTILENEPEKVMLIKKRRLAY